MKFPSSYAVALIVLSLFTASSNAAISLVGVGTIPASATDLSGLTGLLESGAPKNLASFGSGIAYTGQGVRFVAIPDRGPNAVSYNALVDDTTSFQARFHEVDLNISGSSVTPSLIKTTLLSSESGTPLIGLSSAVDATNSSASARLDPEGIRVSRDGQSAFISDEYGPFVYQFDRSTGRRIRVFNVPTKFKITSPSAQGATEITANTVGRVANRGMEGLAITPDGTTLVGIMQSPLIQDGGRSGINLRMLSIDIATGTSKEYVYQLANKSYGVNELVALNSTEFLAIERDGNGGTSAVAKRIYKINIAAATDVSAVATLPLSTLAAGTTPVSKSLLIDLLNPAFGLSGASFPEKIEGLAFGPTLPDGRLTLIVTNDNDFLATNPNNFYVFAMDAADIGAFIAQQFTYPTPSASVGVPTLSDAVKLLLILMLMVAAFYRGERGRDAA